MSAPAPHRAHPAQPWLAGLLLVGALASTLAVGTSRLPPSFPALDPTRLASVDWPRLLPMAWLAVLGLLPWALGQAQGSRRVTRGLLLLALAPVVWLSLHPEPFEEQRLLKVGHGVGTITVVEGGELVQRQWLRSVETGMPLLQLPKMLGSERCLAGIAHAIHHQADSDPRHGYPRALLWASQRWATVAWLGLRFLTLPIALWLGAAAVWPRLMPRRALHWAGLGLLLPLIVPPVVNLLLLVGLQLSGLPDAAGQAGDFALTQLARLGAIGLALVAAGIGRIRWLPIAAAMLLASCSAEPAADAPTPAANAATPAVAEATGPDIVVVLAAGARALLGGGEETGPLLRKQLEATGVSMYTSAYAQSPSSFVSLGSLLTGRYPSAIPMCGLPVLAPDGGDDHPWCATIPDDRHTLPEVLGLYGYSTALLHANLPAGEVFASRFQHAQDLTTQWEDGRADWERIHREAQAFWRRDHDRPHLLVVVVADTVISLRPDVAARTGWSGQVPQLVEPMLAHQPELAHRVTGPADHEQLYTTYQQAVHGLGGGVRGLLTVLGEASQRPRWVVVAGLTGINLGEAGGNAEDHPTWGTNQLLLERTVHVPLFVIPPDPDATPRDIPQPVELVDLFPTLATLSGAVTPSGLPGQDLLEDPFPENHLAWAYAAHGDMLAVRQGALLYSVRGMFHNGTALDPEVTDFLIKAPEASTFRHLHDVIQDPLQQRELVDERADEVQTLHRLLVDVQTGVAAAPEGSLNAERLWELRMTRAEGYW